MSDGSIVIDTKLDNDGLEKGINSLGNVAKKGLKVFTGAIAVAGTALTGLGVSAIGLASNLEEVQNVVDVTFGENAKIINQWAKDAAKNIGMSELAYKKYSGTMGAMLKSMGLADEQVKNMSGNMVELSGDMASFYNLDHEVAFDKIRAGISGETEPLKQLGINMSVANLEAYALAEGISKPYKEMAQSEQAMLRYQYLMSTTADAQGDFARTSDGLANQMRIAQLNMESLSADIGKLLLPVAQQAVGAFNEVGEKLREAFNDPAIQESIVTIAEGVGELVKAVADFVIEWLPKIIDGLAWIADNGEEISGLILAIGSAWATWKVLSTLAAVLPVVIGFVSTLFLELATAPTIMAGVSGAMAMLGGPVTLIIGLIAALVGAVIYLWNTNEDFRNFWIGCWESIKTFFVDCWNGIVSFFTETIPAWIDSVIAWFEGIPQWFSELPGKIGYALGYALACIVQWGVDCWNWVTTEIPRIVTEIITWFAKLPGDIWNWLCDTVSNIIQWGADMYDSACQAASDTVEGIIDWFMDLPSNMLEIGANIVRGLWDGITGMGGWLMDQVSGFCSGLLDGFLGFFGIHSPSRLFRDMVGTNLVKGIGVGIDVEMPSLTDQIDGNIEDLTAKLKGTVDYETAKTTATVVARQNFIVGGTENRDPNPKRTPVVEEHKHYYVGAKEFMDVLAPYADDALDKWREGR